MYCVSKVTYQGSAQDSSFTKIKKQMGEDNSEVRKFYMIRHKEKMQNVSKKVKQIIHKDSSQTQQPSTFSAA